MLYFCKSISLKFTLQGTITCTWGRPLLHPWLWAPPLRWVRDACPRSTLPPLSACSARFLVENIRSRFKGCSWLRKKNADFFSPKREGGSSHCFNCTLYSPIKVHKIGVKFPKGDRSFCFHFFIENIPKWFCKLLSWMQVDSPLFSQQAFPLQQQLVAPLGCSHRSHRSSRCSHRCSIPPSPSRPSLLFPCRTAQPGHWE